MNHDVIDELYCKELCHKYPNNLIVFGDNLMRKGSGGQATIRNCKNSIGLATKVLPTMEEEAFFIDDNQAMMTLEDEFYNVLLVSESLNKPLLFPSSGLGTGLARLNEMFPTEFEELNKMISYEIGQDYSKIVKETLNASK